MVDLYFFACPKERQHDFWRQKLTEILQADRWACEPTIILRPDGKPALQSDAVFFNVSHSGNTVVIAVADTEIGVDMEYVQRPVSEGLRRYCLTEEEQIHIPAGDSRAFLKIWTAKESYLKLYGTGLRQPMKSFSVWGDVFATPDLPPAVFTRLDSETFTLCVAAKQKERLQIMQAPAFL